ncbi:MAG: NFYB/HAP3 family transcription factor subunit [Nanoarchaeota archaeon]|nr:NFYB/HAP3 family transcription factor subunit [Nanoarchaeota archaeon]
MTADESQLNEKPEDQLERTQEEAPADGIVEEEISEEEDEKMPFPTAAVVRLMKKNLDSDKMIKKEVKIAMNKWLAKLAESVSHEMNKVPYTMLHLHEFKSAIAMYENLEEFKKEKDRILAHLDAIKADIAKLERDLGRLDPEEL